MKRHPKGFGTASAMARNSLARAETWRVTRNGILPPFREFGSREEAVSFVREQTGETEAQINEAIAAGCPVMDGDTEYDIEKVTA